MWLKTQSLLAIALIALPALAAHDITGPTYGPSGYGASNPLIASNGQTFLALWRSERVYASSIDSEGRPSTPATPIPLAGVAGVTNFGSDYLAIGGDANGEQRLLIISVNGQAIGTHPASEPINLRDGKIASNGSDILFVDARLEYPRILRADGSLVVAGMSIEASFAPDRLAVASAGSDFVVASVESAGLFLQWISAKGTLLSSGKLRIPTNGDIVDVAVASSGDEAVILWIEAACVSVGPYAFCDYALKSASVARDGSISSQQVQKVYAGVTAIVWAGNSYVAFALGATNTVAIRLNRAGAPMESTTVKLGLNNLRAAARGNVAYAIALDQTGGNLQGIPVHVDGGLTAGEVSLLDVTLRRQRTPALASDGLDFACSWTDDEGSSTRIAAVRVDRNGNAIDSAQVNLTNDGSRSSLVFGGLRFLMLWEFTPLLVSRDFLAVTEIKSHSASSAAWDGERFLGIWTEEGPGFNPIMGAFIAEDGTVSASRELARGQFGIYLNPQIAYDGKRFLVVWHAQATVSPYGDELHAIRVSADGSPIDAKPTVIMSGDFQRFHVASNGSDFAVVVDTARDVRLLAINGDSDTLSVAPPLIIFRWIHEGFASDVTSVGRDYVVSWQYGVQGAFGPIPMYWLATGKVSSTIDSVVVTRTGTPDGLSLYEPSSLAVASNTLGDVMTVVSEVASPPGVARIRAYPEREMIAMPRTPLPPQTVTATGTPTDYTVQWTESPGSAVGFQVASGDVILATVPSDARSVHLTKPVATLSVRAFNEAGLSDATVISFTPLPRHRAVEH